MQNSTNKYFRFHFFPSSRVTPEVLTISFFTPLPFGVSRFIHLCIGSNTWSSQELRSILLGRNLWFVLFLLLLQQNKKREQNRSKIAHCLWSPCALGAYWPRCISFDRLCQSIGSLMHVDVLWSRNLCDHCQNTSFMNYPATKWKAFTSQAAKHVVALISVRRGQQWIRYVCV